MDNGGRQILQEHYQVIVVGAGPAGSAAARFCALSGLKTLIIEEHATPGYPVQCAGLLSINAFQECEVSNESIINTVYGARIETESGHELIFRSKREKAHVVDRAILDIEMLRLAAEAGADVRTKTIAWEINSHEIKTIGINGTASIEYDILIAADGPRSRIRRLLNLNPPKTFIGGVQVEIPWKGEDDIVHIYPDSSPSFFGWSGGSRMPATYVHLSGGDIDRKILEKRGIIIHGEKSIEPAQSLHLKICPNCKEKNSPNANFCMVCGCAISNPDIVRNIRKTERDSSYI